MPTVFDLWGDLAKFYRLLLHLRDSNFLKGAKEVILKEIRDRGIGRGCWNPDSHTD